MVAQAASATLNAGDGTFPHFVPEQVSEIQEEAALNMIRSMERCRLEVPSLGQPVDTAYAEITGDFESLYQTSRLLCTLNSPVLAYKEELLLR